MLRISSGRFSRCEKWSIRGGEVILGLISGLGVELIIELGLEVEVELESELGSADTSENGVDIGRAVCLISEDELCTAAA